MFTYLQPTNQSQSFGLTPVHILEFSRNEKILLIFFLYHWKQYMHFATDGSIGSNRTAPLSTTLLLRAAEAADIWSHTLCRKAGSCIHQVHMNSPSSAALWNEAILPAGRKLYRLSWSSIEFYSTTGQDLIHWTNRKILRASQYYCRKQNSLEPKFKFLNRYEYNT